jgi:curli biogenesis system outer membrane secretion channel CsgG
MRKFILILLAFFIVAGVANLSAQPKKRIAVFTFEDKTAHTWHWWTGQPVGDGMADMLITSLVKTGKYTVLERTEINKVLGEQQLGQSGVVTPESAAKVGQMLGVEVAIMGSVTEFGYSEKNVGGALKKVGFGLGVKSTKATVAVDVRFVNTTTGEILTAESVREEESSKGISVDTQKFDFDNKDKFDESIVGKATRKAIDKLVTLIDAASSNLAFSAKIIKADGPIFINAGASAGVNNGDEFVVYRKGEELTDPDTGISLGATETKVGRIKVTNNNIGNGKASQCDAIQGSGFQRNDLVKQK